MEQYALVANLDRCVGCFTCEVACKQEHNLPAGDKWIRVSTIGPYEIQGEKRMDFVPLATGRCDLCARRAAKGEQPFCVRTCPTGALGLYDERELLRLLRNGRRYQIARIHTRVGAGNG